MHKGCIRCRCCCRSAASRMQSSAAEALTLRLILPMPLCHPVVDSAKQDRTTCTVNCISTVEHRTQQFSAQQPPRANSKFVSSLTKHGCDDLSLSKAFVACCLQHATCDNDLSCLVIPIKVRLRRVTGSLPRTELLKLSISSAGYQAMRGLLA